MAKARRLLDDAWSDAENNILGEGIADMDETVYGKNSGVIGADGGPCPLIGILNRAHHAAAVIHVLGGCVEQNEHSYVSVLEALQELDPELFEGAEAVVCMDKNIPFYEEGDNSGPAARTRYCRNAVRKIKRLIPNTRQVMRGEGKYLRIDTANLNIRVIDDEDNVLFEA
jgi:hypothetical protein